MQMNSRVSELYYDLGRASLGEFLLVASGRGLRGIFWNRKLNDVERELKSLLTKKTELPIFVAAKKQLEEYFSGKRKDFDLPLDPQGTDFQKRVWQSLRKIPYGETICYEDQAVFLGNKNLTRAVGAANGANPISIVIPCHRVVGKNGNLTGFLYGVDAKAFLLKLEKLNTI